MRGEGGKWASGNAVALREARNERVAGSLHRRASTEQSASPLRTCMPAHSVLCEPSATSLSFSSSPPLLSSISRLTNRATRHTLPRPELSSSHSSNARSTFTNYQAVD